MTTTTPTAQRETDKSQFAAVLRRYQYYNHGRSLRRFCDNVGLDHQKFCKYALEHGPGSETSKQGVMDILPVPFIEVCQEAETKPVVIRKIHVCFTNGMIQHGCVELGGVNLAMIFRVRHTLCFLATE